MLNSSSSPDEGALRLSVRHFGPIASGDIELKPLTVLIGANNSGKSYVAQLIYVISRILSVRGDDQYSLYRQLTLSDFIGQILEKTASQTTVGRLEGSTRDLLQRDAKDFVRSLEVSLFLELIDYFGMDSLEQLVQDGSKGEDFSIHFGAEGDVQALVKIREEEGHIRARLLPLDLDSVTVPDPMIFGEGNEELFARAITERAWLDVAARNGIPERAEYYLPSARSGILTAWPLVTSMMIGIARRRIGLEPIGVAALSGVAGDFLQIFVDNFLTNVGARRPTEDAMRLALDVLEGTILQGQVSVADTARERSSLLYETGGVGLPVQRASSMVAELAPLDLWIKHLLRPGDLLVIDEPEAHLHPENQRRIARVLVRLVSAGVRVICPTHSSLIVHQLSNHLLANDASVADRRRLGFDDVDLLDPGMIGVYLFDKGLDGTHIRQVPIEPGFGISEEEFVAVAEAIGDESYRLSKSALKPVTAGSSGTRSA